MFIKKIVMFGISVILAGFALINPKIAYADTSVVYWDTPVAKSPQKTARIKINGVEKISSDIEPVINEGHVFVPVSFVQRFLAESTSEYENGDDYIVEFDGDKVRLNMTTGEIIRYDLVMANPFPPYSRQNTVMIPLRTIAAAFNYAIDWDAKTSTVSLTRHSMPDVDKNFITHY